MEANIAQQHEFNRRNFTQVKRHALMVSPLPDSHAMKMQRTILLACDVSLRV